MPCPVSRCKLQMWESEVDGFRAYLLQIKRSYSEWLPIQYQTTRPFFITASAR
jgi:hypothetical protein